MLNIFNINENSVMCETVSFGVSLSCIFIYSFLSKELADTSGKVSLFRLFLCRVKLN